MGPAVIFSELSGLQRACLYGLARSMTTSATPSTRAYVPNRNAPYLGDREAAKRALLRAL